MIAGGAIEQGSTRATPAVSPGLVEKSRSYAVEQNAIQYRLTQLVNGGFADSGRARAALAGWRPAWREEARPVSEAFQRLCSMRLPATGSARCIRIEPFPGRQAALVALRDFVEKHVGDDLAFCMVHGSLATGEEIDYSDVDALVVLKNEVVRSPLRLSRAARALCRARTLMYAFDALQHHGWFVLTEQDLRCHCEAYFPAVLFKHGALLVPYGAIDIHVSLRDSRAEMLKTFRQIVAAVRSRIDVRERPRTLYALKTLLSHVMLLPSLYIQIRDGEGVWKGCSFEMTQGDFSAASWQAVEIASEIRRHWPDRRGLSVPWVYGPMVQKLAKRLAPKIPHALDRRLDDNFYESASAFVDEMEKLINEIYVCDWHGPLRDEVSC